MSDVKPFCAILIEGSDATLYSVRLEPKPSDAVSEYMYKNGYVQVYSALVADSETELTFYNPHWVKKELLFFIK